MKLSARKICLLLSYLIFSALLYAGGVLSSPRKIYVVKTNHFEILFPKESAQTAHYIAEQADSLYEKAKSEAGLQKDFVMPIIISPDSSVLDVKYTNNPYNRIVIYDSVADETQFELVAGSSIMLSLLYREIFRAVSCSVRSPFNEFVYKFILGDYYQPIALINLPFSFSKAYSDLSSQAVNDRYYQQLLIQAKIEGKFPTWFQAASIRDIHPGNDLCYAASTGFAAYLMQSRGLDKYIEFWNECGKLHPYLMNGIFSKVYGDSISAVWKEFENSVPLPLELEQMYELEDMSREVSENDRQGAFENILYTRYGVVWYDSIRHEVDIFDNHSSFKIRQLLFIADDITKLSLSPDGRYVSASFTREKSRPEFKECVTRIFDLKNRVFLKEKFELCDAAFIKTYNGEIQLAGISVNEKVPVLQLYSFDTKKDKSSLVYEKRFDRTASVFSISAGGSGNISYLLADSEGTKIVVEAPERKSSRIWTISDENGKQISPFFLQYISDEKLYTFSYYPEAEGSLVRSGFIRVSETSDELVLKNVYLQNCDISGGVYYPVIASEKLYYCARKFSHNEMRYLPLVLVNYADGNLKGERTEELSSNDLRGTEQEEGKKAGEVLFNLEQGKLGYSDGNQYDISKYNLLKYMSRISFNPFFAIRDITIDKGPVYWPTLGMFVAADADPLRNTQLLLSGAFGFLELSFEKKYNIVPVEPQSVNSFFDKIKTFNFAAYLENSSTPVDISAGAIFNFHQNGEYNFKCLAKTAWTIPVGNILRNMEFTISSVYTASTDYYDENKWEYHPSMEGWTPLTDSYELFELSFSMVYSNSHQYGISKYEKRGLTLGGRIYTLWDLYEIEQLNKYRDEIKRQIVNGTNNELTEIQLKNLYNESLMNISQFNLGVFADIEIPRLTMLEIKNGWVLSMPTVISAEFMNKPGIALEGSVETLLIGREIQNGPSFLYLFFSRLGLKAGYDFRLEYDTTKVNLPDIRRKKYITDIFSNTTFSDSVFATLNTDFLMPTGKLSEMQLTMDVKVEYFIRTNGLMLSLNVYAAF